MTLGLGRDAHEARLFVGTEVEHTRAYGQKTLFVADPSASAYALIRIARQEGATHIYLGANQSLHSGCRFSEVENLVGELLADPGGFLVSVDLQAPVLNLGGVNDDSPLLDDRVIVLVSVKVPGIFKLANSRNAVLKLDDYIGPSETINPGVWCSPLQDVMCPTKLTPWSAYANDKNL